MAAGAAPAQLKIFLGGERPAARWWTN